eukprot:6211871-Pleurochrysis_carterae.AAC.3
MRCDRPSAPAAVVRSRSSLAASTSRRAMAAAHSLYEQPLGKILVREGRGRRGHQRKSWQGKGQE